MFENWVMEIDKLPEEIVRNIFSYLSDAEIHFKLKHINHQFRHYANSYVQLGKFQKITQCEQIKTNSKIKV